MNNAAGREWQGQWKVSAPGERLQGGAEEQAAVRHGDRAHECAEGVEDGAVSCPVQRESRGLDGVRAEGRESAQESGAEYGVRRGEVMVQSGPGEQAEHERAGQVDGDRGDREAVTAGLDARGLADAKGAFADVRYALLDVVNQL